MSLPSKGTRSRTLLEYLATVDSQDIAGVMENLAESVTGKTIRNTISEMYLRGHVDNLTIEQEGDSRRSSVTDIIALTPSTRYELEDAEDEVVTTAKSASLVPPRHVNVMTGPQLHPSKFLNPKGTREGSDWSQFPSRQL